MSREKFRKRLSANDVGATGAHQGGLLIPKSEKELLAILPKLDARLKNPDMWIECIDDSGNTFKLRFVYYNNRLHDPGGTRNEYRITHMTTWFRDVGAREGDHFEISRGHDPQKFEIAIRSKDVEAFEPDQSTRIRLRGWQRVH